MLSTLENLCLAHIVLAADASLPSRRVHYRFHYHVQFFPPPHPPSRSRAYELRRQQQPQGPCEGAKKFSKVSGLRDLLYKFKVLFGIFPVMAQMLERWVVHALAQILKSQWPGTFTI